jgi:hypothetical protein
MIKIVTNKLNNRKVNLGKPVKKKRDSPEIKEIKLNIKNTFKGLVFVEDIHKYYYKNIELLGTTTFLKRFSEPFDEKKFSKILEENTNRKIKLRNSKSTLRTTEYYLERWKSINSESILSGHRVHTYAEINYPDFLDEPYDEQEAGVVEFYKNLPNNYIVLFLELRMFSKKYKRAGTADIILYNKNTNKIIIGDYKGLPLSTPILTNNGWKIMGNLSYGDKVFDRDGNLSKIKHISEIHHNPCYEINFDNGENITADHEHRWEISFSTTNPKKKFKTIIMTTEEIFNYLQLAKKGPEYIPKILNPKPINLLDRDLPIHPYLLGVWLGDGHKADSKITQANKKVWRYLKKLGYKIGKDISGKGCGKATTRTIHGISKKLKKLNLIKNKHIPDIYYLSSYKQRLELLRGFMDADGYYNKIRNRYVMSTSQEWQKNDIIKLLATLGIKSSVFQVKRKLNPINWDVCFTTDLKVFRNRNNNIKNPFRKQHTWRNIKSIKITETVPTRCIEVDSPSNTFLAGNTMIVTHNTNKKNIFTYYKNSYLLKPFNFLPDHEFSKYSLQLSDYQNFIEMNTPYEVEERWIIHLSSKDQTKLDMSKVNKTSSVVDLDNSPYLEGKYYKIYKTKDFSKELIPYYTNE